MNTKTGAPPKKKEDAPFDVEQQFILRLPPVSATFYRDKFIQNNKATARCLFFSFSFCPRLVVVPSSAVAGTADHVFFHSAIFVTRVIPSLSSAIVMSLLHAFFLHRFSLDPSFHFLVFRLNMIVVLSPPHHMDVPFLCYFLGHYKFPILLLLFLQHIHFGAYPPLSLCTSTSASSSRSFLARLPVLYSSFYLFDIHLAVN